SYSDEYPAARLGHRHADRTQQQTPGAAGLHADRLRVGESGIAGAADDCAVLRLPACAVSELGSRLGKIAAPQPGSAAESWSGQTLTWHAHEDGAGGRPRIPSETADSR